MKVRKIAFEVLNEIYIKKAYANLALNSAISSNDLSVIDRTFLTRVVYGTLQNSILLEYQLNKVTQQKKVKPKMRIVLLMSLYQLRYMEKVPSYATINEAVEIMKEMDGQQAANFANGVLRNLNRMEIHLDESMFKTTLEYYSVKYSHPLWLLQMMEKHYGEEITKKICEVNQTPPNVAMRVNTLKVSLESMLELPYFRRGKLAKYSLIYTAGNSLNDFSYLKKGEVFIQDESSQFVAEFLNPIENSTVLDMCAAPGSKSINLGILMKNTGKITALDLHPHRVKLIDNAVRTMGLSNIETKAMDATKVESLEKTYDYVLLDAPCSGYGVIRRKPDILLKNEQGDLDGLIQLQAALLEAAYRVMKNQGTLVYSTCTLNKKENNLQIESFLNRHEDLELVESRQIFPFEYDSDGFYMAKIKRKG